jgi:N-acetylmuramoyl-L-alanine amidase
VANILRGREIDTVLTRTADYGAILSTRAALADALGATLMVSIHHNSAPSRPPSSAQPGTEVFVQATPASERLGGLLYQHVTGALAYTYDITWYRSADAGVLRVTQPDGLETYGMIRNPSTTTALIEMGWLSDPVEAAQVFDGSSYVSVAARALADAIQEYLAGSPSSVAVGNRTFTARPANGTDRCTDPALE